MKTPAPDHDAPALDAAQRQLEAVLAALDLEIASESASSQQFELRIQGPGVSSGYGPNGQPLRSYALLESGFRPQVPQRVALRWRDVDYPALLVSCDGASVRVEAEAGMHLPGEISTATLSPRSSDYSCQIRDALTAHLDEGLPRRAMMLLGGSTDAQERPFETTELLADDLTDEQADVLAFALGSDVTVVVGDAGAGKSHCLAKMVQVARMIGYRVLVTGKSSRILESSLPRVAQFLGRLGDQEAPIWAGAGDRHACSVDAIIARDHPALYAEMKVAERELSDADSDFAEQQLERLALLRQELQDKKREIVRDAQALIAPVGSLAVGALKDERFDLVIVESASHVNVAELLLCACRADEGIAIFADPYDSLRPERMGLPLPAPLDPARLLDETGMLAPSCRLELLEQHRMNRDVLRLTHEIGGRRTGSAGTPVTVALERRSSLSDAALVVIDTSDQGSRSFEVGGSSHANPMSAVIVTEVARRLAQASRAPAGRSTACATSAYYAQCALLAGCLRDLGLVGRPESPVLVGSFGQLCNHESDVVLLDATLAPSAPDGRRRLLRREYEPDVTRELLSAITRTSSQFVLVADVARVTSVQEDGSSMQRLLEALRPNAETIGVEEALARLDQSYHRRIGSAGFFHHGSVEQIAQVFHRWGREDVSTRFYLGNDLEASVRLFDLLHDADLLSEVECLNTERDQRPQAICVHERGFAVFSLRDGKDNCWMVASGLGAETVRSMYDRRAHPASCPWPKNR